MDRTKNIILSDDRQGNLGGEDYYGETLQTERITSRSNLAAYREAWRKLSGGAPMQSPEWYLAWLQHYAEPGDEPCVLLFRDSEDTLVGLAPLFIQKAGGSATVRLLGSGDACTNHTTWLTAPGWETRVGQEVAQFLLDNRSEWDSLHFEWVDEDDSAIYATIANLEKNGCLLRKWPMANCWKIDLPSTWDDYLKTLSKKHRKQCRRFYRKYIESGMVRVHRVRNEGELHKGFKILLALHAARWGDPSQPQGVFTDRQFRAFHERVARELLNREQLHLSWLEYDGKPIAAEYQFIDQDTLFAYQAGMDPAFAHLRPGKLSILSSIRFAIEQGCHTLDLSRGNEPYKVHYRATPTPCHDLYIWPDRIGGHLGYSLGYSMKRMRYYAKVGRYLAEQWLNKGTEFIRNGSATDKTAN